MDHERAIQGAHELPGLELKPPITLVVETTDASGHLISRDRQTVVRPSGPVRQHEQLVRAVTRRLPDARITSAVRGRVDFICRGYVVTSSYEDDLEPSPAETQSVPSALDSTPSIKSQGGSREAG